MIDRGELRSFRLGVLIRIPADEVERIECQNTQSSDSEDRSPSCGTRMESDDEAVSMPKIGRARRQRPGEGGGPGTIHRGPWPGSGLPISIIWTRITNRQRQVSTTP